MKKIFYIAIFFIALMVGNCQFVAAQTVTISQETANELYQGIAERNELRKLVTAQTELIASKDRVISELEKSKLTPCVIAINSFTDSLNKLSLPLSDNSKVLNKEIIRNRKTLQEIWKQSIKSQCNFKDNPKWWSYLIQYAPLGVVLLKR